MNIMIANKTVDLPLSVCSGPCSGPFSFIFQFPCIRQFKRHTEERRGQDETMIVDDKE
jgi:hypothetical protein